MAKNEWEKQEQTRELIRLWRMLNPRQRAGLNCLADSILKREAVKRGYFETEAAGVIFHIRLN